MRYETLGIVGESGSGKTQTARCSPSVSGAEHFPPSVLRTSPPSHGPGDFIIISANPIPGNEKSVTKIVNGLLLLGAEVTYDSHGQPVGVGKGDRRSVLYKYTVTAALASSHNKVSLNLNFIEPIDITTIFGNLLDNAIEATEKLKGEKYICIKIGSYHKMIVVSIENNCNEVKWRNGFPVSNKGKNGGIGLLNVQSSIKKYDGDLTLKNDGNKFAAELFLNS